MKSINLSDLSGTIGGIHYSLGLYMQHCAVYCLTSQNHLSGVKFNIKTNKKSIEYDILWDIAEDTNLQKSIGDEETATEFGAMGLAVLLTLELTDYKYFESAIKGTGVDFWLFKDNREQELYVEKAASLEISGIRTSNVSNNLLKRLNTKKKQAQKSKDKSKQTYIAIIEFGKPESLYISLQ